MPSHYVPCTGDPVLHAVTDEVNDALARGDVVSGQKTLCGQQVRALETRRSYSGVCEKCSALVHDAKAPIARRPADTKPK